MPGSRNMGLDLTSHAVFLAGARFGPLPRWRARPDSGRRWSLARSWFWWSSDVRRERWVRGRTVVQSVRYACGVIECHRSSEARHLLGSSMPRTSSIVSRSAFMRSKFELARWPCRKPWGAEYSELGHNDGRAMITGSWVRCPEPVTQTAHRARPPMASRARALGELRATLGVQRIDREKHGPFASWLA